MSAKSSLVIFAFSDYGQISKIAHLTVTEGRLLQANLKNRHFARNRGSTFTGKSQESTF